MIGIPSFPTGLKKMASLKSAQPAHTKIPVTQKAYHISTHTYLAFTSTYYLLLSSIQNEVVPSNTLGVEPPLFFKHTHKKMKTSVLLSHPNFFPQITHLNLHQHSSTDKSPNTTKKNVGGGHSFCKKKKKRFFPISRERKRALNA